MCTPFTPPVRHFYSQRWKANRCTFRSYLLWCRIAVAECTNNRCTRDTPEKRKRKKRQQKDTVCQLNTSRSLICFVKLLLVSAVICITHITTIALHVHSNSYVYGQQMCTFQSNNTKIEWQPFKRLFTCLVCARMWNENEPIQPKYFLINLSS